MMGIQLHVVKTDIVVMLSFSCFTVFCHLILKYSLGTV